MLELTIHTLKHKNMKQHFFIILFSLFILNPSFGQGQEESKETDTQEKTFKHALGLAAGFTTGYGVSYRISYKNFTAQAAFAPYKSEYNSRYSAGLSFNYTLIESKWSKFFIYQGTHYLYHSDSYYYDYYDPYSQPIIDNNNHEYVDQYLNIGLGFGIEFVFTDHLSCMLMTGYAGFQNFERINLTAETGFFYTF